VALAGPFFDRVGGPPLYLAAAVLLPLIAAYFARGLSRA
jgi:hypothetical protein